MKSKLFPVKQFISLQHLRPGGVRQDNLGAGSGPACVHVPDGMMAGGDVAQPDKITKVAHGGFPLPVLFFIYKYGNG